MGVVAQDSYTDTNGDNIATQHTPEIGSWTKHGSSAAEAVISSNRCRPDTGSPADTCLFYTGDPGVDDYEVEVDVVRLTTDQDDMFGCCARVATGALTAYFLIQDAAPGSDVVRVGKVVATVVTSLGTTNNSANVNLRLRVGVNSQRWFIADVEQGSGLTDTAISARGRPGIYGITASGAPPGDGVQIHLDNYLVDDLAGGGAAGHPTARRFSLARYCRNTMERGRMGTYVAYDRLELVARILVMQLRNQRRSIQPCRKVA